MAGDIPTSGWAGLSSGGLEIAGNSYARVAASFAGSNLISLQWPMTYPLAWGLIDGVQVWDSASGGTLLVTAPVSPGLDIAAYDVARVPAGGLVITEAIVGTPYSRGPYGRGRYATRHVLSATVTLLKTFSRYDPCRTGAWTPAEPCEAGSWATLEPCTIGAWNPAQSPLRRAA